MDGVGRRIAVRQDEAARRVIVLPDALIGRVAVDRVEGRGRVGVDAVRVVAELAVEIHPDERRRRLEILRKLQTAERDVLALQPLGQKCELCGFSGTVGSLKHDQFSHVVYPLIRLPSTANRYFGSRSIRPNRFGSLMSR